MRVKKKFKDYLFIEGNPARNHNKYYAIDKTNICHGSEISEVGLRWLSSAQLCEKQPKTDIVSNCSHWIIQLIYMRIVFAFHFISFIQINGVCTTAQCTHYTPSHQVRNAWELAIGLKLLFSVMNKLLLSTMEDATQWSLIIFVAREWAA